MATKTATPRCRDGRDCFAKRKEEDGCWHCKVLTKTYKDGECPFCKEKADVYKGKTYPFNPFYGGIENEQ